MIRLKGLIGFKYLKRRRLIVLALVVSFCSTLFSVTALSLLGFQRGFTAYLGEGEDIIVVYDRKSSTPFTGLIPAYLSEKFVKLDGVLAVSLETIAPCSLKGESIFLRGIVPREFTKLNQLTIIEGSMLEFDDLNSVIVGKNVADRLNVRVGDRLLVLGTLTDHYIELHVKGIFVSSSAVMDEVLAPLYVGQWLRGTDYGHVTLIRLKIDRNLIIPSKIFEEMAKEASEPTTTSSPIREPYSPNIIPRTVARFRIEDLSVGEAYKFMIGYMERYGLTKESLLTLSIMVFLFSSASIIIASETILIQHRGESNVLRSIGVSKKLLKIDLMMKLLPLSLAASLFGFVLAVIVLEMIQEHGYLRALSHTIPIHVDPIIMLLNLILATILVSIGILRSSLE